MLPSPSRDNCSASHAPELTRKLLRSGLRLCAQLRVNAVGLGLGPTLDDRVGAVERARERLLQLEHTAEHYAELSGADLLGDCELLLGSFEPPRSWPEAALAQLLLCLAARVELQGATASDAYACEAEHLNAARAALAELGTLEVPLHDLLRDSLPRWLTIACATLEPAHCAEFMSALDAVLANTGVRADH